MNIIIGFSLRAIENNGKTASEGHMENNSMA